MSCPADPPGPQTPPVTGDERIDAALAGLADLEDASAGERLQRLAKAHEVLAEVLENSRGPEPHKQPLGPGAAHPGPRP